MSDASRLGAQSMVSPLLRVIVRRPGPAFSSADPTLWQYSGPPDGARAEREHAAFVARLESAGAEVVYHDEALPEMADALYVHDPAIVTEGGAVLLSMGKALRSGEVAAMGRLMERLGVPVLGAITGGGRAEGGDLLWLDARTLAVGIGFRTNLEGAGQLQELLGPLGVVIVTFDLPFHDGPASCLHLMSLTSLVDQDLAVVFSPLLPVRLWELYEERAIGMIEVPEQEFVQGQATNVLALAPRHCLMLAGNPHTEQRLADAGCRVETYRGEEISLKGHGGATCLTRPVLRG